MASVDVGYPNARALAHRALDAGAFVLGDKGTVQWHIAMRCLNPPSIEVYGRDYGPKDENRYQQVTIAARCRRCLPCRQLRSYEWRQRGMNEILVHPRTLFGTLTLRPEEQYRASAEATERLAKSAVDFNSLSADDQFAERVRTIGSWITRYFKRVRQETDTKSRYMLVAESHKSGLPHFHLLFHEVERYTRDQFDTYTVLKRQWPYGFSDFQGVDAGPDGGANAARYVCKYLAKAGLCRVRSSLRYGRLLDIKPPTAAGASTDA